MIIPKTTQVKFDDYYTGIHKKSQIYLHHTAGNDSGKGVYRWWKKDIKPIFVVAKHIKDNNKYYQVYYQPSDTTNTNYWLSGHQGKDALQQQLLKKLLI